MEVCKVGCCLYMKIVVLHDRSCHAELRQAWMTVLYPTVEFARGVQAFQSGKVSSASVHHSGHCHVCLHTDLAVDIIDLCLDEDRLWTVKELPEHVGISGSTVLQVL
jgi:hypothetical protein